MIAQFNLCPVLSMKMKSQATFEDVFIILFQSLDYDLCENILYQGEERKKSRQVNT